MPEPVTPSELAALRAAAAIATPRPWVIHKTTAGRIEFTDHLAFTNADAHFVAIAANLADRLAAEVQRLTTLLDAESQALAVSKGEVQRLASQVQRLVIERDLARAEVKRLHHLVEYTKHEVRSAILDVLCRIGPTATPEWIRGELERIADGPNLRPVAAPEAKP